MKAFFQKTSEIRNNLLGGRLGYFLVFSARGGGRGSLRRREGGGVGFFLKIPGGGVSRRGEGPRGREGVCGELGNWGGGGGGLNFFFFSGPKCPPSLKMLSAPNSQRFLRFAIAMPIADPRNR